MRSYTLRALRPDAHGNTVEIDIDFVLHGVEPGAAAPGGPRLPLGLARRAPATGSLLLGPAVADNRGVRFRPPEDTDLVLIWADETAAARRRRPSWSGCPPAPGPGSGWRCHTPGTSRT